MYIKIGDYVLIRNLHWKPIIATVFIGDFAITPKATAKRVAFGFTANVGLVGDGPSRHGFSLT